MLSELLQQISSRGLRTLLCARRWQVRLTILSFSFSFSFFFFYLFLFVSFLFCIFVKAGRSRNLPYRSIEYSENAHSMAASSPHSRLPSFVLSMEVERLV